MGYPRSVPPAEGRSHLSKSPSRVPSRNSPSPAMASGSAPPGLRQRQVVLELPAGADAELGEHLVQVVLRRRPAGARALALAAARGAAIGRTPGGRGRDGSRASTQGGVTVGHGADGRGAGAGSASALASRLQLPRCVPWWLTVSGCRCHAGPGRWLPPAAGRARSRRRTPDRTGLRPACGGPGVGSAASPALTAGVAGPEQCRTGGRTTTGSALIHAHVIPDLHATVDCHRTCQSDALGGYRLSSVAQRKLLGVTREQRLLPPDHRIRAR